MKNKIVDVHTLDEGKSLILKGRNFNFQVPENKIFSSYIEKNKKNAGVAPSDILATNERIIIARLYPEIAQLLAYSVYQKYQIVLVSDKRPVILKFIVK